MEKMNEGQIEVALKKFPEWSGNAGSIQRTYAFKDFVDSMSFVNRVAQGAEADQHHPDILIRWNKVTLTLSTHDAGGVTQKDFDLAAKCDAFAEATAPTAAPPPPPPPAPPASAAAPQTTAAGKPAKGKKKA